VGWEAFTGTPRDGNKGETGRERRRKEKQSRGGVKEDRVDEKKRGCEGAVAAMDELSGDKGDGERVATT